MSSMYAPIVARNFDASRARRRLLMQRTIARELFLALPYLCGRKLISDVRVSLCLTLSLFLALNRFVQLGMAVYGITYCSSATVSIGEKVRRFSEMDHLSC